tara:strand:- start:238 stop:417 length:180 start_codon:yes stop_codon:yes gene_type:complete
MEEIVIIIQIKIIIPTIIIQEVTTAVLQIIQEAQITLVVQEAQVLEVLPLDLHQMVEDK